MTDPIADFFARIRNAGNAGHDLVRVGHSQMKESIAHILKQEGFVSDVEVEKDGNRKNLVVHLRYEQGGKPMIHHLRRISKPGQRVYSRAPSKPNVRSGLGFHILSTSKGVMTDREAMEKKVGGELIAEIW